MSSKKKSNQKIFNVLWSSQNFGGAEIYVETMRKTWGTETIALENLSLKEILSLAYNISFGSNNYVFHDIRAALLGFFSPNRKHITVVHGPGRRIWITKVIIFLHAFMQRKVILVSSNIFQMQINKRLLVLENFSTAGIQTDDTTNDAIYFGRISESKGVPKMLNFWVQHKILGKLHVVGDGNLLNELIERFSNQPNICFYGSKSHNEIAAIASKCRYYVSFSEREGLSLSLLEAMDGGLIPLVKNIPSQSFVHEIEGIPAIEGNLIELVEQILAIDSFAKNRRKTLQETIQNIIRDRFRNKWINTWSDLLNVRPINQKQK